MAARKISKKNLDRVMEEIDSLWLMARICGGEEIFWNGWQIELIEFTNRFHGGRWVATNFSAANKHFRIESKPNCFIWVSKEFKKGADKYKKLRELIRILLLQK